MTHRKAAACCPHCLPGSLGAAALTAKAPLGGFRYFICWAGEKPGTQNKALSSCHCPPRPLGSCFREEWPPPVLPSHTPKGVCLARSRETPGPRNPCGRACVTLGLGGLGSGCHPEAVTVGSANVAKQGFNPILPSRCLSKSLGVSTSVFSPTEWASHVSMPLALFDPGRLRSSEGRGGEAGGNAPQSVQAYVQPMGTDNGVGKAWGGVVPRWRGAVGEDGGTPIIHPTTKIKKTGGSSR